jgi:hypothetical protein
MESETIVIAISLTDFFPISHMILLSFLILLTLTLFILGLKKSDLKFQWLLSSFSIWIGLFGGISLAFSWFKMWIDVYFRGYPTHELWALDQLGAYFRLGVYLSLTIVSWTLSIVLKLIIERNRQPVN